MYVLREVLERAQKNGVAIGHFNIADLVLLKAVFAAAQDLNVPVLVGASEQERKFIGVRQIAALVRSLREQFDFPIFLNADHTHCLLYNGLFELVDCWTEQSGDRKVFKFKLQLSVTDERDRPTVAPAILEDDRLIPSWVTLEVWKRDQGRCQKCGTTSGLHFDHIIPYSKGGSSKDAANIQILCGSHNLSKRDNIE